MTNDAHAGEAIRAMIAVIEKGDVNGIRLALDFMDECREYVANGGVTYGKYGLARELFSKNHEQWLRTLLARVDALEKVAAAGKALVTEQERLTEVDERVRQGLAYESGEQRRDELWRRWGAFKAALSAAGAGE